MGGVLSGMGLSFGQLELLVQGEPGLGRFQGGPAEERGRTDGPDLRGGVCNSDAPLKAGPGGPQPHPASQRGAPSGQGPASGEARGESWGRGNRAGLVAGESQSDRRARQRLWRTQWNGAWAELRARRAGTGKV